VTLVRTMVAVAALAAASPVVGQAAGGGGVATPGLGGGSAVVASCDDVVSVTYEGAPGPVTSVVVGNVAGGCAGARLSLVVVDTIGTAVASGGVASVSGASVTVPVSPAVDPERAKGVRLVLVGP
jgi:hypothetical protein